MRFDHPFIPFLGRLLIVYIFATSGIGKVLSWQSNIQYMSTRHLPAIPVFLALAAVIELGGSLSLITGFRARSCDHHVFLPGCGYRALSQLLGRIRYAGGNAGDALPEESCDHGWPADSRLRGPRTLVAGQASVVNFDNVDHQRKVAWTSREATVLPSSTAKSCVDTTMLRRRSGFAIRQPSL
jgi:DoxX